VWPTPHRLWEGTVGRFVLGRIRAPLSPIVAGSTIAGYRIEEVAGRGSMGVVYRATQLALERPVALKVIATDIAHDGRFRERFKREAQLAAAIDHPNVIPVHEAGEADGALYLAMRYVDGTDLGALIAQDGALAPARAVRIVGQVAAALTAAHARGLVHRDVKPANVLIAAGDEHVYLADFGLTKRASSAGGLTRDGMFVGTLDYCAPEQIRGERADPRTDVYALGCVLYHCLTGRTPFDRDSEVATMYAHLNDAVPAASALDERIPAALDAVVATALAKDPAARYPTATDLGRALHAATSTGPRPPASRPGIPATNGPASIAAPGASSAAAGSDGMPRAARLALGATLATALAAGLAAAVLAAAGVIGGGSEDGAKAPAKAATVAPAKPAAAAPAPQPQQAVGQSGDEAIPSGAPRATAATKVGRGPDGIAVDTAGSVWVTNAQDNTLTRIDERTGKPVGPPLAAGADPDGVVADKGVVWVASAKQDRVLRFEAPEGDQAPVANGTIAVGHQPEGISLGRQLVWVANIQDGTVNRIDRASPAAVGAPIGVGSKPTGIFVGTTVWVTNNGDDTVTRIDPSTAQVVGEPIPVGHEPRGVVEGAGGVWVANSGDNTVSHLDPATGKPIGAPIKVGRDPRELAVGLGFVWVANNDDNTVTRIDPDSGRVVGSPIAVGNQPLGIAVGPDAVWVANHGDDTVTRIEP
jgi:YVTN family beta-propeller protein